MLRSRRISPGRGAAPVSPANVATLIQVVEQLLAVFDETKVVRDVRVLERLLGQHPIVLIVVADENRDRDLVLVLHHHDCVLRFRMRDRQGDGERRALTGDARRGDRAAVALDDLSANRQADPRALVLRPGMESLEHSKDLFAVLPA